MEQTDKKNIDASEADQNPTGLELLPTKELDEIWTIILEEYPELARLELDKIMPSQEDFLAYTGGEFVASTDSGKPSVRVILGDIKHLESLRTIRSDSVQIILKN